MKLARLAIGGTTALVAVEGDRATPLMVDTGEPWVDPLRVWLAQGQPATSSESFALSEARVLAPVRAPQKIIAVGLNYKGHAAETGKDLPTAPMLFGKSPGSIIGTGDAITFRTSDSSKVDYEAELAVIIGTRCRDVAESEALNYVFGYTTCNDVSARDAQKSDVQYLRAKSFDTFCPLGPFLVTADEIPNPQNLAIRSRVNGELRQGANTSDMVFSVAEIISYISRFLTLESGDVIATGTPAGVGLARTPPSFLTNGDVVEIEIESLGLLTNPVVTRV